jgi:hypothetical protein
VSTLFNAEITTARSGTDVSDIHIDYDSLHPSTEPEAIRADQREAIKRVLEWAGRKMEPEEISKCVILPLSIVKKRLREIKRLKKVAKEVVACP